MRLFFFSYQKYILNNKNMENFETDQSFRTFTESVSNKSYLELLERYILLDKTSDLDKKHKEWSNNLTNN